MLMSKKGFSACPGGQRRTVSDCSIQAGDLMTDCSLHSAFRIEIPERQSTRLNSRRPACLTHGEAVFQFVGEGEQTSVVFRFSYVIRRHFVKG